MPTDLPPAIVTPDLPHVSTAYELPHSKKQNGLTRKRKINGTSIPPSQDQCSPKKAVISQKPVSRIRSASKTTDNRKKHNQLERNRRGELEKKFKKLKDTISEHKSTEPIPKEIKSKSSILMAAKKLIDHLTKKDLESTKTEEIIRADITIKKHLLEQMTTNKTDNETDNHLSNIIDQAQKIRQVKNEDEDEGYFSFNSNSLSSTDSDKFEPIELYPYDIEKILNEHYQYTVNDQENIFSTDK